MEPIKVDISKEWLSVADVCEYMGVSPFVVTTQLRAGALPAVKFGREWRIARQDFEDWLNAQRMEARPESEPSEWSPVGAAAEGDSRSGVSLNPDDRPDARP